MVQILEFAVLVIVISASGVMAPGPLFAANISYGLREGISAQQRANFFNNCASDCNGSVLLVFTSQFGLSD